MLGQLVLFLPMFEQPLGRSCLSSSHMAKYLAPRVKAKSSQEASQDVPRGGLIYTGGYPIICGVSFLITLSISLRTELGSTPRFHLTTCLLHLSTRYKFSRYVYPVSILRRPAFWTPFLTFSILLAGGLCLTLVSKLPTTRTRQRRAVKELEKPVDSLGRLI